MKSILQNQRGYAFYAKIDLKQGFHQIPLHKTSRYLTAFVCEAGLFEWTVIPFGVQKGPSYFQQALATIVLVGLIGDTCDVFIDDIIIGGHTATELLYKVKIVLDRLRKHRLIVNAAKCLFWVASIEYLGQLSEEL